MHGAKSKRDGQGIWRDAKLIEKSMAGLGHKETQLIYRFVSFSLSCFFLFYFFFILTTSFFSVIFIELFALIGILSVLKLSRALINSDMGRRLRLV